MTADPATDSLAAFRGDFPRTNLTARRIAAALEAPGCHRRTVLDAGVVDIEKLGLLLTDGPADRQSPFAITRGNQFENQVLANDMGVVIALARRHLGLDIPEVRQVDLSAPSVRETYPDAKGAKLNELRARLTRQHVEHMLTDPTGALNLIRHAMTRLSIGGEVAFLEQDVLAFAVKGRIHVVEIKSFPSIDGRADPTKASSAVRQTAVYVISLQDLVMDLGAPPDVVDTTVMIVMPENLSFRAVAQTIDTDMQVRRLRRQLANVPAAADILVGIPEGVRLPAPPSKTADEAEVAAHRAAAQAALSVIPARFVDGCVSCPLFRFCRDEAENHQSTSRLGAGVAGACGSVTTIPEALDLAEGRRVPENPSEAAVAAILARGAASARLATPEVGA